jgi:hypothetical protein
VQANTPSTSVPARSSATRAVCSTVAIGSIVMGRADGVGYRGFDAGRHLERPPEAAEARDGVRVQGLERRR